MNTTAAAAHYGEHYDGFACCHVGFGNNFCHVICTTVGVVGGLRILRRLGGLPLTQLAVFVYTAFLYTCVRTAVWVASAVWSVCLFLLAVPPTAAATAAARPTKSRARSPSPAPAAAAPENERSTYLLDFVLVAAGYFGQDLSHYFTGEATFQSTYSGDGVAWDEFVSKCVHVDTISTQPISLHGCPARVRAVTDRCSWQIPCAHLCHCCSL